jgi:hypothetical protein
MFHTCPTNAIPITTKSIRDMTLLDQKSDVEPDIVQDWKLPIDKKLHGKFDVISTMCCDGTVFITNSGFEDQSFDNVIKALKKNGFFIMDSLAIVNIKQIATHLANEPANAKINKQNLLTIAKHPLDISDYPKEKTYMNNFIAYSIEQTYPKLKLIKDPIEFLTNIYDNYSETRLIKDAIKQFKESNLNLFQKM